MLQWAQHAREEEYRRLRRYAGAHGWKNVGWDGAGGAGGTGGALHEGVGTMGTGAASRGLLCHGEGARDAGVRGSPRCTLPTLTALGCPQS